MSHYEPKEPFDGYDPDNEYPPMMDFINHCESIQSKGLGEWLFEKLAPKSVIDIGCGPGLYLLPFKEAGCKVFGIDACPTGGELLTKKEFERVDLRFPYKPKKRYDLAICFEVAEHLPEHYADRLIDTLSDCADLVVFSGAVPGQGGTYHMNEQPHSYWLTKFKERHNYMIHPLQDEMRAFLAQYEPLRATGEVSGWLIDNTFLLQETLQGAAKVQNLDGSEPVRGADGLIHGEAPKMRKKSNANL